MPVKLITYKNKTNDTFSSKKGSYVSFNSVNPFKFNPYAYKSNETIRLDREIVEEVKDDKLLISCRNHVFDQKVHFRRNADEVGIISQTRLYLWCAEEPRVPWYGLEGCPEGFILQFDSEGRPVGYIKANPEAAIKTKVLQQQQVSQYKITPTLDTPPPSLTKLVFTSSSITFTLHHTNNPTYKYLN